MTLQEKIDEFLSGSPFAVVGASTDRAKYGNKVLRAYIQTGRSAYPINPKADEVENIKAFPDLRSLPEPVHGISVITPPPVTEKVVAEAAELGIRNIWMQPGAESPAAVAAAEQAGMNVIADGTCALVVLGFREDD
jgi:predicted CoA-binding protein